MRVEQTRQYPLCVQAFLKYLTSQAFYEERFRLLGVEDYRFQRCEQTPEGFVVHIVRRMEVDLSRISAFARGFIGSTAELSTEFVWQNEGEAPYLGRYYVNMAGAPAKIEGQVVLNALSDSACEQEVALTIHCSVPLVGKKLAALLAKRVEVVLEEDYQATLTLLKSEA